MQRLRGGVLYAGSGTTRMATSATKEWFQTPPRMKDLLQIVVRRNTIVSTIRNVL